MAENAASAHRRARPAETKPLMKRILSALVLIPLALLTVYLGGVYLTLLVALAVGVMAWEWGRMVHAPSTWKNYTIIIGFPVFSVILSFESISYGYIGSFFSIIFLLLISVSSSIMLWLIWGIFWITVPSVGFLWLRADPDHGFKTALWIFVLVWVIDTAAFAVGRLFGGPKLASWISPNKTWAGLLGGMVAAWGFGFYIGYVTHSPAALLIGFLCSLLAVVEQIGDMAESYAKRRFDVKDSSGLIPGHGGVLDRLDGMLAVVTVIVVVTYFSGGSIFTWR